MEPGGSFVRWLFLDPGAQALITNWDHFAAAAVGALRLEVGRRPEDARLLALVAELRDSSAEVAGWWDDHGVRDHTSVDKLLAHPQAGPMRFGIEAVTTPHDPDQRLVVYTVEPDSATEKLLPLLSGWAVPEVSPSRAGR